MKLEDIQPHLREMLALFEAFRRLRFTPSEIYAAFDDGSPPMMVIIRDGKSFAVPVEAPPEACTRASIKSWLDAAQWWNEEATHEDRAAIFEPSKVAAHSVPFILQLMQAGMLPTVVKPTHEGA